MGEESKKFPDDEVEKKGKRQPELAVAFPSAVSRSKVLLQAKDDKN